MGWIDGGFCVKPPLLANRVVPVGGAFFHCGRSAVIRGSGAQVRFGSKAAVQCSREHVRCSINTGNQRVVFPLLGVKPT